MEEFSLFHELCETECDDRERRIEQEKNRGITASHITGIGGMALYHLHQMADAATIDRCLKKLREERRRKQ